MYKFFKCNYMKKMILLLILGTSTFQVLHAQYFNKMTNAQRDSVLVAKAKEVVLKYAKDYYREYGKPAIEFKEVSKKSINKENWDRGYYVITFPYDTTKESFGLDYAAQVTIWSNTGMPDGITAGNGWGYHLLDKEPNKDLPQLGYEVFPPRKETREALARRQKRAQDSLQRAAQEGWNKMEKERRYKDSLSKAQWRNM